ncbi:phage tail tape measure protein [Phocaeicola plebeius]|uniref:phage tail tape measure protein n=1 Tax=Phocaeicola plebeius TaxID=310297 RepID=UPI0039959760
MGNLKLKDFVDEESLKKLQELRSTISDVRQDYKDAASELIKGLTVDVKVKGDIDKLQAIYNTQAKNVSSASEKLTDAFSRQAEVAEQLMKKIKEKADAEKLSTKEVKELSKASAEASKAMQQAAKAEEAMNKAQKSANTTRKAAAMTEEERIRIIKEAISLSDKEVHSIEEANEVNKKLRQAVRLVRDTDEDYRNTLGKLNSTIGVNTDYVKRNSDRYTQQKMTIGSYKEEVKAAWMELNHLNDSMGSFGIISGSFGDSLQSLGNAGSVLEGLSGFGKIFQNKWLLGLGAVGAAGAGIGWWVNYNKGLTEATRLTQQFTEKSGEDLKAYRTEVQAIADFYGKDFKEVLIGANAVSKQFGISAEESLKLIQDGFIAGADANGEFLDTLREYPAYFKEAGISAETFIAITAQAAKSGIYSDKGVDVIKEGNLRIREMTTATAAALEGIGISADEVQEQLKSGQKTTFDIIQMVSERLNELPDSASVVGTALADIFGGPGEDAGLQYIRTLKDIKTNLGDVKAETGELGKAQEDMIESQKLLSKELALLFDATGGSFETMSAKIKSSIASMTADLLSFVRRGIESVEELSEREEKQARAEGERYAETDVIKQYEEINKAREQYVKQGMSEEEAFKKAKEERIDMMKRSLKYEEQNLKDAVSLNEKYYDEYQNASLWKQMFGIDRTNSAINSDIRSSWGERMSAERGVSNINRQISLVESYQMPGAKRSAVSETADEKSSRLEAEKSLQESRIALMEEGLDKELAIIRYGYQQKIDAVKGNSSAEMALRKSLLQEMNNELAKASEEYEKNRASIDLQNRLASVEEGSEEEMSVRLDILDKQKEEEMKAAESNGADVSLIEKKYINEKRKIYEEYAADYVDEISKSAAAEQVVRNAQYNSDLKELEKLHAKKLVSDEEYEKKKADITERYSIDTAKAAVDSLEEQISVENLSQDDREKLAEQLHKAKADLANAEADAEIAAIKRVQDEEEDSYKKRMKNAQRWMGVASDAIGAIGNLMSTLYERDIEKIEDEQEANEEAYNADVERIEALAESGAISEEEAEVRKRAAEAETSRKNEELEKKKVQLQQKQAKWDKAVQIAQTGIATARGIMEAWQLGPVLGAVMAAVVAAMGAVQVATIAATPIPAYKEGTKNGGHIGGLAIVGDGGKREVVVYGGKSWVTPDVPTVVDLPKGAEVFPDISEFNENVRMNTIYDSGISSPVVVNDYSELSREMKGMRVELRKIMKIIHKEAYNSNYEHYKSTIL